MSRGGHLRTWGSGCLGPARSGAGIGVKKSSMAGSKLGECGEGKGCFGRVDGGGRVYPRRHGWALGWRWRWRL